MVQSTKAGIGLRLARWLFLVPLSLLCLWAMLGPPTGETMVFATAILATTVAAFLKPSTHQRRAIGGGLLLAFSVVLVRLGTGAEGATITNTNTPDDAPGRWLDRVVPERELALGGSRLLATLGAMPGDEPGLLEHLADGYGRMRAVEGAVPSPVLGNFVLGQTPADHGTLRVAPPGTPNPGTALVFLHGYIGSTTLSCWQVAQGAAPLGIETTCPAMNWRARWDSPAGRRIARDTIASLRADGAERVFLAGLSAGAIGASRIARDLQVDGVILLSGSSRHPRPAQIPTLVLQGARDPMTPPRFAKAYADRVRGARYVEYADAGHWMVLSHHEEVSSEVTDFLSIDVSP